MYLISIEGIDGTGKTTLWNRLKTTESINKLKEQYTVRFVQFPTSWFFEQLNELEKQGTLDDEKVLWLQNEDKKRLVEEMEKRGVGVLICDRGDVSQMVYNKDKEPSIQSDLVVYLHIQLEEALRRIQLREVADNLGFEQEDTLKEIQIDYERIIFNYFLDGRAKVWNVTDIDYNGNKQEDFIEDVADVIYKQATNYYLGVNGGLEEAYGDNRI